MWLSARVLMYMWMVVGVSVILMWLWVGAVVLLIGGDGRKRSRLAFECVGMV